MSNKTKLVGASRRHIFACGGGFTSLELLEYILKHSGKKTPRVLIINTATGDSAASLAVIYKKLGQLDCRPGHLTFFERTPVDLRSLVLAQDVIWVGGGNTKSMLAVWREYGLDKILVEAWTRGIVLAGSSAGGICWFEGCVTDSYDVSYTALPGLGMLKGSCCPHYDGEKGRQASYHRLISQGQLDSGVAIDEGVGLHYVGSRLLEVVAARAGAGARTVQSQAEGIIETPLKVKYLRAK